MIVLFITLVDFNVILGKIFLNSGISDVLSVVRIVNNSEKSEDIGKEFHETNKFY